MLSKIKTLFLFCILSLTLTSSFPTSPSPWSCYGDYCFWADDKVKGYKSLSEVQTDCTSFDPESWPLEIYNENVNEDFMKFINGKPNIRNKNVTLNIKRVDTAWKWVDGSFYDGQSKYDNSKSSNNKISFHAYKPYATLRNLPFRGIYGPAYSSTQLNNYVCTFNGPCPINNRNYININGKCFVMRSSDTAINWFQAYNLCYKDNGFLASFSGISASLLQSKFAYMEKNKNYWIGLFNSAWTWQHNKASISNYTNWYTGFPYHPYLETSPNDILTYYDYSNGGIWMDECVKPNPKSVPLVCMKNNPSKPPKA